MNLEEKKNKLLEKYGELFKDRTGYSGIQLDTYVTELIKSGEEYYGSNFTEDILREKRNDSILWLMDQVTMTSLPSSGSHEINEEDANNFQAWAQSLVTDYKMTPAQANEYASNPSNRFMYEKWLLNKQKPKQETQQTTTQPITESNPISKTQMLLDKHGDLITKRIFGGHFQGELNAVQEEQLNDKLAIMIENGKLHYGDNFLDELINNNSKENVAKVLRSLSLTPDEIQTPEVQMVEPIVEEQVQNVQEIPEEITQTQNIENQVPEILKPEDNIQPQLADEQLDNTKPMVPVTAKLGKRKEANPKLIDKFKTYWKNASFKKKLLIGAVAIGAVAGIVVVTATAISNMLTTQSFDAAQVTTGGNMILDALPLYNIDLNALNNVDLNALNNVDPNAVDPNAVVDWSGITEGTEVYTTMDNAAEAVNALSGNEWMQVDHMEAVDQAGNVVNLDGMTNSEVINTLDSGDYQVRGSNDGTYMGWFTEDTVKDAINQGRSL